MEGAIGNRGASVRRWGCWYSNTTRGGFAWHSLPRLAARGYGVGGAYIAVRRGGICVGLIAGQRRTVLVVGRDEIVTCNYYYTYFVSWSRRNPVLYIFHDPCCCVASPVPAIPHRAIARWDRRHAVISGVSADRTPNWSCLGDYGSLPPHQSQGPVSRLNPLRTGASGIPSMFLSRPLVSLGRVRLDFSPFLGSTSRLSALNTISRCV